ncbi:MAG: hypothetical protein ABR606_02715, partial [Vicinamibacterales bacterium]
MRVSAQRPRAPDSGTPGADPPIINLLERLSPASVDIDLDVQHNTALGCRTSEAALTLLAQLIRLEGRDVMAISTSELETLTARYTALVAELEPKTAT